MPHITKTATASLFYPSLLCSASTSRLTPFRNYATESEFPPTTTPNAPTFGTTVEQKIEKAETKRYTGPGFPAIPSLRHVVRVHHPHLWQGGPMRELTIPLRRHGGRNNTGTITTRHIGGGHKRRLRNVDFYRFESGAHDVVRVEYDPGRSAHIALIKRREGSKSVPVDIGAKLAESDERDRKARDEVKGGWSYILAPDGLRAGDVVVSYRTGIPKGIVEGWDDIVPVIDDPSAPQTVNEPNGVSSRALGLLRTHTLRPGNVLPLYLIPPGTIIHNLSLEPNGRMQLCRSAGVSAQIVAHQGAEGEALGGTAVLGMGGRHVGKNGIRTTKSRGIVLVKLRSGEVRRMQPGAVATIGLVSNKEHHQEQLGTAGAARHLGRRPKVRGVAMNTVDHPHGGGRGKSKGNKQAHSVYGKLTKGVRTRRPKHKGGNKMVVTERPRGRARR